MNHPFLDTTPRFTELSTLFQSIGFRIDLTSSFRDDNRVTQHFEVEHQIYTKFLKFPYLTEIGPNEHLSRWATPIEGKVVFRGM